MTRLTVELVSSSHQGEGGYRTCIKAPRAQHMAAFSKLASSKTMADAFPPSSSSTGFTYLPAVEATIEPTAVLPVKLTLRTAGFAIRAVVTADASDV